MATALSKTGEKRRQYTPSKVTKNIWENFEPEEIGALAAFVKAYQAIFFWHRESHRNQLSGSIEESVSKIEKPYCDIPHSHAKRCWTPLERLLFAIDTFSHGNEKPQVERMPLQRKDVFRVAQWDRAQNIVTSASNLPADSIAASKEIYDAIIAWDESFLDQCVEKYGYICEKLGFKKVKKDDFAPLTMEKLKASQSVMGVVKANEAPAKPSSPVNLTKTVLLGLQASQAATPEELVSTVMDLVPGLSAVDIQKTIGELLASKKITEEEGILKLIQA